MTNKPLYRVAILAYDGFATFELACGVELFSLPRPEIDQWYFGEVVTFEEGALRATGGIRVEAKRIRDLRHYDILVVPSWPVHAAPINKTMAKAVTQFVSRGGRVLSFCSGAFFFAELGLLDGRNATTHWKYAEAFKARFPQVNYVDDVLYVYEGNIGCSAGSAAAIDLGLEVIRQDFGYETANLVARRLVISAHRNGGQSQFVETPLPKRPSAFSSALDWALKHLPNDLKVEDLANKANMSRRSFDRHFRSSLNMSPLEWLTQQKIKCAQQMLESTSESVDLVAQKAGFNNALTLRLNFNKYLGISPSQYRQQFRACSD